MIDAQHKSGPWAITENCAVERVVIRHMDEELFEPDEAPPGMESTVIRLHMPASDVKPGMKAFELLPELLRALRIGTHNPHLPPEGQRLLETARCILIRQFMKGSELPPMTIFQERLNGHNAILRIQLYLPTV